ncbi:CRISPR-associated primase-polymerase type A1 [Desulfobacca acetoxidans]
MNDTLLEQVNAALTSGRPDQAQSLALSRDTRDLRDPALHLAWADLLEELGLIDEVVKELHLALRDNPDNPALYPRLADIYQDLGRADRAAHVWANRVKRAPEDVEAYRQWGELLREQGDPERARQVFQQGLAATQDPSFNALLRDLDGREQEPLPEEGLQAGPQLLPGRHHLVAFTALFAGREGVYARQWASPTGETGYTPVQEPLTLKVAENHILGNYTIGVYPVRLDNTVNFLALDFDLAKFAVRKAITSQRAWQTLMDRLHQAACRLVDLAAAHDLPVYLEDSGFKGRHAWIFPDTPIPAGIAKKCGDLLLAGIQPLPAEVTVEVFPKQTSVKKGGLGNLIKLPLGFHKRTGRRAVFLHPDGRPLEDQLELLQSVVKAPRRAIYALIQRLQAGAAPASGPEPAAAAGKPDTAPPWETAPSPAPLPVVPEIYHLDQDTQFQFLLSRCPVLKALADKVNQTSMLTKDETLVLIHTVGHLENGPAAVNELFQRCLNADPTLFLKSRLRGHPMSCPKIRARIPDVTAAVACNCAFDLAVNLYPTPIIHLHGLKPGAAAPTGLTLDSLQFQHLLQEYVKLRQQLRETQLLLTRYEQQLSDFFTAAGVETVNTPLGTLCRKIDSAGKTAFILEI